jgi:hypothetical protein
MMTADKPTTSDDDLVEIFVRPPRDLDRYQTTTHFGQRLRERVPERHHGPVPKEIITDGRVTRRPWSGDNELDEPGHPVAFTGRVDGKRYTVIVALRPSGYRSPDTTHDIITVYRGKPPSESAEHTGGRP